MGRLFALLGLVWALAAPAWAMTPQQYIELLSNPRTAAVGQVKSLTISDGIWTSSTDLTPVSQFVNGWTADAVLIGTTPAGNTSAYTIVGPTSCTLSFSDSSPGYNSSASPITVSRTICGTSWLRQTYANPTLPTETANSGNAKIALTLNDFVYSGDSLGPATALAAMYHSGSVTTKATNNIPVTNSSTRTYPRPICAWITPPGQRIGTSGSLTVEMFCGHAYAQGGTPVAAGVFTLSDGTHSVSHTISTLTPSAIQFSTSCTATHGSNQLTSCGSTAGLQVGERMNVPGIPGQPRISALTSTAITFSQIVAAAGCTPKTNGEETITGTPGVGEGLGDGAFVGQTITDANLNTNPATITTPLGVGSAPGGGATETLTMASVSAGQFDVGTLITYPGVSATANLYVSALGTGSGGAGTYTIHCTGTCPVIAASTNITGSAIAGNPGGATTTSIKISTNSASGSAVANACTINQNYQGSTGSVTATLGNPLPVYSATFTSGDISGASIAQGAVYVRAQVYPNIGNVVLDTQTGADGTQCDWFFFNVNAGVCNSSSAAWFATNGQGVSPNLHNLWAYNDADNSYSPYYCFVGASGTATTVAACSTSPTAPTAACTTTCAASINGILTAVKAYNNNGSNRTTVHNDLNGIVACYLAGSYAGFGGAISGSVTANKPGITMTSVADSTACPSSGSANANTANVTFAHNATTTFLNPGTNARINNVTISDSSVVIQGADATNNTTFPISEFVYNNDKFTAGGVTIVFHTAVTDVYNSFVDESAHEGNVFFAQGVTTSSSRAFFNTVVGATYSTAVSGQNLFVSLGNDGWGLSPNAPLGLAVATTYIQPTSVVAGYNRYLGLVTSNGVFETGAVGPLKNFLDVDNIFECMNRTGTNPCVQISADGVNIPMANVVRTYETVAGARTNSAYLEGIPLTPTPVGSGGSLAAGTYFSQIAYALVGNPTVQTSTDGPTASFAVGGTGTDSLSYVLPCDPNYVFYIYVDTTATPAHYATVGGVDAKQITGCQTVVATAIGGAATAPTVAGTTGHNEFKTSYFQRFDIDYNCNNKGDTYNGSGATNSGGRVGNWEARWRVGWIGTICVTGTVIGSGYSYNSGLGEIAAYLDTVNPSNTPGDISWVTYTSDRSFGGQLTDPAAPALNTGEGDYCPSSSTNVGSRVPSGFAAYPWDINGTARKSDGTGYAGAYETGCR